MKLESIILKTGNVVGHLVSAGLFVDSVNNVYNGNYKFAAFEGLVATYIQVAKYFGRKRKERIDEFSSKVYSEYVPQIQELRQDANLCFDRISKSIKE